MKYFDSHAHYYDERFKEEYEKSVDELIGTLLLSDVSHIVNIGTNCQTSRLAIEQAKKFANMYTAIGIHPTDCQELTDLDADMADIESLIKDKNNKCVCLGEIGLDYHYDDTDKEKQFKYFDAQLTLAKELDIPICIHDREAHNDVLEFCKAHKGVRGILHSFSGSAELAKEFCKLGYMISFSGTLTFKNARKSKESAIVVPHDRLLIETDCPYLAPHPLRGTLNHSGNLKYTNATLAELIGLSEEECAQLTSDNAKRIFNL